MRGREEAPTEASAQLGPTLIGEDRTNIVLVRGRAKLLLKVLNGMTEVGNYKSDVMSSSN